ncbi:MFS transporter [Alicyclobacillaceae bacterium I2511]|nr:MFS transporter [Alicyclobacillaceae bacterium I2511]
MWAGWLGDKYGRKFVMQYTLLTFTITSIIAALSWNSISFGVLRFITGIGVGGESAIVTPYLAELMPIRSRGRLLGISDAFFTVGAIIASLINLVVIPSGINGWRIALVIAGIPALYVWVIRKGLPESPRWLAIHNKSSEAREIYERVGVQNIPPFSKGSPTDSHRETRTNSFTKIWSRPLAGKTVLLWITWFFIELVYYGFLVWIPSLLVKHGLTIVKSLEYSFLMNIAALVGGVVASAVQDTRWGRKLTIILFFFLSGISSYLFSIAKSDWAILLTGCILSFLLNGLFSMLYTFTPEQYPTETRATGQGFASAFGHIGGTVGPLIVGLTLASFGVGGVFTIFAVMLIVPMIAVSFLSEMRNKAVYDTLDASHQG